MRRVKLTIAYDGTNYCGWQIQQNGITVEEVINRELSRLLKEDIHIIGASRTDSGVHARGNVAVFDTEACIPPDKISYALNQSLPDDIVIQDSCEVDQRFHPRYCKCRKTYEYRILNASFPQPCERLYTQYKYTLLDVDKMRAAAAYLVGEHDFTSFCTIGAQVKTTIRTIYEITIMEEKLNYYSSEQMDCSRSTFDCNIQPDNISQKNKIQNRIIEPRIITVRIAGNGFLYNMIRIIIGTLIKVGNGIYPPEHILEILDARDRSKAGPTAGASGLTLAGIEFDE